MAHIIINPSLSAAIGYNIFFNPPKFAVVIAILEPANSTRTDNSQKLVSLVVACGGEDLTTFWESAGKAIRDVYIGTHHE